MTLLHISIVNSMNQPIFAANVRGCSSEGGEAAPLEKLVELIPTSDQSLAETCQELELLVYQSIDLIDLQMRHQAMAEGGGNADNFCGLYSSGVSLTTRLVDVISYAYVASSHTKVIAVLEKGSETVQVADFKQFLKAVFRLYADTVLNPFYDGVNLETSSNFLRKLRKLLGYFRTQLHLTA